MFCKKFQPLFEKCKNDLNRWSTLLPSLAGRVSLIKMVVLPKFLYLFQHVPIFIKNFNFKLDQIIYTFLWGNKPTRIRRTVLQLPPKMSGLALPNFIQYYWACNIQKLLYWVKDREVSTCPLCRILRCPHEPLGFVIIMLSSEMLSSHFSLHSLLCSQLPLAATSISENPVVTHSIKMWIQFRKHFGQHGLSKLAPTIITYLNHLASTPHLALSLTEVLHVSVTFITTRFYCPSLNYHWNFACLIATFFVFFILGTVKNNFLTSQVDPLTPKLTSFWALTPIKDISFQLFTIYMLIC